MSRQNKCISFFALCVMTIMLISGCISSSHTIDEIMPVVTGTVPESLTVKVDADDVNIGYLGRIDFQDPKNPSFTFPAITITARFIGTAIAIVLTDSGNRNYYNVIIDENEPVVIRSSMGTKFYTVAQGLANTEHTIIFSAKK